jgi:hypothetical protein
MYLPMHFSTHVSSTSPPNPLLFFCIRPVLVSLGLKPKLEVGTLRGVVRVAGDFCCEALGLAPPLQPMAGMSME